MMKSILSTIALAITTLTPCSAAEGLLGQAKNYVCYQSGEALKIDGAADEKAWKDAPWTDLFIDIEGDKKAKPHFKTRAKMLWDDKYFYFYAEMDEPHIWATYDKRDMVIFHENDFEIFIDPDADTHAYYELEINAKETVWDLMLLRPYRDGGGAVDSWDILGLKKAVKLNGTLNDPSDKDRGWSVEIAIPWKVLEEAAQPQSSPKFGDQWRVNFSRVQWQLDVVNGKYQKKINPVTNKPFAEYNWVWSPQGVIAMHQPESWGRVQFSGVTAGKGTEKFVIKHADTLREVLREVYYAQANRKQAKGDYATKLDQLVTDKFLSEAVWKQWGSHLSMISDGLGYRCICAHKGEKLVINGEGRVVEIRK